MNVPPSLLESIRTPLLTDFFLFLTQFGDMLVVIITATGFSAYLFATHRPRYVPEFLLAVIGTALSVSVLKMATAVPRPDDRIALLLEDSYSFPSGHAAMSTALFGFMLYVAWVTHRSERERRLISVVLIALIALVSLSRLYLGVHYVSDVVAGVILGTLWVALGHSLARRYTHALR